MGADVKGAEGEGGFVEEDGQEGEDGVAVVPGVGGGEVRRGGVGWDRVGEGRGEVVGEG